MAKPNLSAEVLTRLAGKRLATAESLTGGGIGQAITSVSGASRVYAGGIISYTNEVKHQVLGVPLDVLDTCGAVSAPVAKAMAEGTRARLGVDIAVSATGMASPGESWEPPAGTVFVGVASAHGTRAIPLKLSGSRAEVRQQTVESAIGAILAEAKEHTHEL